jgi:pimeloyl-ACP methyl ester carboxylesterase
MSPAVDLFIRGPAGLLSVRTKGLEAKPRHVVVMVQGSNLTGQTGFDLQVPGGSDYSVMDAMVARGIGAVTFALRGYGLSEAPSDPFTVQTDAAIEDLATVIDWLAAQGAARPHLLGWSWGGRIGGRYAGANAAKIGRLVLMDPALGVPHPIMPAPENPWWINSREDYLARAEPQYCEPGAFETFVAHVLANDARAPNGIRMELSHGSAPVDPALLAMPVLLLYAAAAGRAAYMKGGLTRQDFFEALASDDKAFVIVPDGGDYATIQRPRRRIHQEIADFLLAQAEPAA